MIAPAITTLPHLPIMPAIELATASAGMPATSRVDAAWTGGVTVGAYVAINQDRRFGRHFSKLMAIRTDRKLWPEGGEAPHEEAIAWASEVLRRLEDDMVLPSRVVATAEGGVAICFAKREAYADIECFNDGAILGVVSNGRDRPVVWEIEPRSGGIAWASARIRKFLMSPASGKDDSR